jgi:S-sulfo-L-cysteine synthase (O-acetyl-L-serine-dependent)
MMPAVSPRVPNSRPASVLAQIGNTPLVRLERIAADIPGAEIFVKLEFANPGGSVKDRPALNMILDGERTGRLVPGRVILDATSGNTGIAYAMIGAIKGYAVKLCLPANASLERKRILKAYGAKIIFTDPMEGSDGAIRRCREIYEKNPDLYFYPDQYNNPANWRAHYETTAVEILHQTDGHFTHFVAGLGTSGTFTGVTRRLRVDAPYVECWSVQPSSSFHGLEGMKHMPTSIVPGIYDPTLAAGNLWIDTEEAHAMARRLAREEGLLVGVSSGANIAAALKLAKERGGSVVTIACDGASKYLSEPFWDDSNS